MGIKKIEDKMTCYSVFLKKMNALVMGDNKNTNSVFH